MSRATQDAHVHRSAAQQSRRLLLATAMNGAIVVVQVVAGLAASSLGLLADAGHNLADTLAVALALVALRLSRRQPAGRRTYGGLRWPVLAAQANAATLLLVTVWLVVEAARRLAHPAPVDGAVVLLVAGVAAAVNAAAAGAVHERHGDLNTRAAVSHLVADAAVSVAVAAAGAVIWATGGWDRLDPGVTLVVALLVGWQGIQLLRQSSSVLLETTPPGVDLAALRARLSALPGVVGVHDVHVWSLSDRMHAASVHVCVEGDPTLTVARRQSEVVKAVLATEFGVGHATVELETATTADAGEEAHGCAVEPDACAVVSDHLAEDVRRGARGRAQSHL